VVTRKAKKVADTKSIRTEQIALHG